VFAAQKALMNNSASGESQGYTVMVDPVGPDETPTSPECVEGVDCEDSEVQVSKEVPLLSERLPEPWNSLNYRTAFAEFCGVIAVFVSAFVHVFFTRNMKRNFTIYDSKQSKKDFIPQPNNPKIRTKISFFRIHLGFWILLSLYYIIDRFYWQFNLITVNGNLYDLWDEYPAVTVFKVYCAISGRFIIIAQNALFVTSCNGIWNWHLVPFLEKFFYIGDWHQENYSIHRGFGIMIGIATLLHIFFVFLPPVFHDTDVRVGAMRPGRFFAEKENVMNLGFNDMVRIFSCSAYFLLLFPISLNFACLPNGGLQQLIHIGTAILYAWDNLRITSHPHSHIWNTPFVILYLIDAVYVWWGQTAIAEIVYVSEWNEKIELVLFKGSADNHTHHNICDIMYLSPYKRGSCNMIQDWSHKYTVFYNRMDWDLLEWTSKFAIQRNQDSQVHIEQNENWELDLLKDGGESNRHNRTWDFGIFMDVHALNCYARMMRTESFSSALATGGTGLLVNAKGPFTSGYRNIALRDELCNEGVLVVAGGSGMALIVDTVLYILSSKINQEHHPRIVFTSKHPAQVTWLLDFLQFVTSHRLKEFATDQIKIEGDTAKDKATKAKRSRAKACTIHFNRVQTGNLVTVHLTESKAGVGLDDEVDEADALGVGRAQFKNPELYKDISICYFLGSEGLAKFVGKHCEIHDVDFRYSCHGFS